MMPSRDVVVEEVREIRRQISAEFGHDPARLVAHYMTLQEQYRERMGGEKQVVDRKQSDPGAGAAR